MSVVLSVRVVEFHCPMQAGEHKYVLRSVVWYALPHCSHVLVCILRGARGVPAGLHFCVGVWPCSPLYFSTYARICKRRCSRRHAAS